MVLPSLVVGLNLMSIIFLVASGHPTRFGIALSVAAALFNILFVCRSLFTDYLESMFVSGIVDSFFENWPIIMMFLNGIMILLNVLLIIIMAVWSGSLALIVSGLIFNIALWTSVSSFYYAYECNGRDSSF